MTREGEIRRFAKDVLPQARFIFDNYKVKPNDITLDEEGNLSEGEDGEVDYFSFFSSHEKVALKPESNFKGIRSFLHTLPIDYYILLQEGFEKRKEFEHTNYIYVRNIPLLSEKKTFKSKAMPVKTIRIEDVYRCVDRGEAEALLRDPYAENEMIKLLEARYGQIDDL